MEELLNRWKKAAEAYEKAEENAREAKTRTLGRHKKEVYLQCITELERATEKDLSVLPANELYRMLTAGWVDSEKDLPAAGTTVDVMYMCGSINVEYIIEKGSVNKRGRFSGEMDWKVAVFWKPACS